MPRQVQPLSQFREAHALAAAAPCARRRPRTPQRRPGSPRGSSAVRWSSPCSSAALLSWLYHHFVTRGASLDLNAMNTMLLVVGARAAPQLGGLFTRDPRRGHRLLAGARALSPLWRRGGAAAVHERRRAPGRGVRRLVHAADVHVPDRRRELDRRHLHPVQRRAVGGPGLRHVAGRSASGHDGAARPARDERRRPRGQPACRRSGPCSSPASPASTSAPSSATAWCSRCCGSRSASRS